MMPPHYLKVSLLKRTPWGYSGKIVVVRTIGYPAQRDIQRILQELQRFYPSYRVVHYRVVDEHKGLADFSFNSLLEEVI